MKHTTVHTATLKIWAIVARTATLGIGVIVITAITVAVTFFSGNLFGRWGYQGWDEAAAVLKELPMDINGWRAETEEELEETSISMLRIQNSYLSRTYTNRDTQASVLLILMVGPTGRITVHTPEGCFGGRNFLQEGTRERVPIDVRLESGEDKVDTFWRVDFVRQSLAAGANNRISFYYGVNAGDEWQAVDYPRVTFQRYRYVYRIQAEAYTGTGEDEDHVKKFLEDCLPTIHEYLLRSDR